MDVISSRVTGCGPGFQYREAFYREILPAPSARSGKTSIVVSHDERYFDLCDRIVWFEMGGIKPFADPRTSRIIKPEFRMPRVGAGFNLPSTRH
jgi:ABC-type sulfate/molybdate transport systems ATPase subunit